MFITFEGTEGSGKSLQARLLVEGLRAHGLTVCATHEPGGTVLGDQVRQLVLVRNDLHVVPRAEALLMNSSRAQLCEEVLRPALERGEVVVCDRFADSTLVYQGAGRGVDPGALAAVISFATADLRPDLTILLDLPVDVGLARKQGQVEGWNRFEAEAVAFHTRVRAGYHALAKAEPDRWYCFDAGKAPDELAGEIWDVVGGRLGVKR